MVRRLAESVKRASRSSGRPVQSARVARVAGARRFALGAIVGVIAGVLAGSVTACAAQDTTIDEHPCPDGGTTLTYDDFGKGFLDAYCQKCHGQTTDDRNGAPADVTFKTIDDVHRWRERIFARAALDNTTMPPGPDDPPRDERYQLADWLACGAK